MQHCTLAGVIGFLVLAGIIVGGGLLSNVNKGASPVVQTSSSSLPPVLGVIYRYVGEPTGLPAIGAPVVAAEQQTGYTVNSIVSIAGQYTFTLPQGK